MSRKIEVQILGDSDSLHRALSHATGSTSKFGSILGGTFKAAAIGAGAALVGLGIAAKVGFSEMEDRQKAMAQTNAVLKSTGGVAKVTAQHVNSLAQSLSNLSGVDDEVVQGGENMLLTFTHIRNGVGKSNDIFDQATATVLDLSTAMGLDMKQAALQVGKALNDPIRGYTRLQRIGVQFSAAQIKQITAMTAAGNEMGAQKVILAELNKEFGGSAKAAGETLPGQLNKLKETLKNVAGTIASEFLPYITRFVQWAAPLMIKGLQLIGQGIKKLIGSVGHIAERFASLGGKTGEAGARIRSAWSKVVGFFQGSVMPVIRKLRDIFQKSMENIAKVVQQHGPEIRRIFDRVSTAMKAIATVAFPLLRKILTSGLPKAIGVAITALDKISFAIETVVNWMITAIGVAETLKGKLDFLGSLNKGLLSDVGININQGLLNQHSSSGKAVGAGSNAMQSPTYVVVKVDGREIAHATANYDKTYKRQNGRSLFA